MIIDAVEMMEKYQLHVYPWRNHGVLCWRCAGYCKNDEGTILPCSAWAGNVQSAVSEWLIEFADTAVIFQDIHEALPGTVRDGSGNMRVIEDMLSTDRPDDESLNAVSP